MKNLPQDALEIGRTDLVGELRHNASHQDRPAYVRLLFTRAADEIERLRAKIASLELLTEELDVG